MEGIASRCSAWAPLWRLVWSAAVGNQADQQPCSCTGSPGHELSITSGFISPTNWILSYVSLKADLKSVHALLYIFNPFRFLNWKIWPYLCLTWDVFCLFFFHDCIGDRLEYELIYNSCISASAWHQNIIKHHFWNLHEWKKVHETRGFESFSSYRKESLCSHFSRTSGCLWTWEVARVDRRRRQRQCFLLNIIFLPLTFI